MKTLNNFMAIALSIFMWSSCTDSIRMNYTESKSLPLEVTFDDTMKVISGIFYNSTLLDLFEIPQDAIVSKFSINGFSIQVHPTAGSEADFVEYIVGFKGQNDDEIRYLIPLNRHFISTGDAFNVSSEMDPAQLADLKCKLESLVIADEESECYETGVFYSLGFKGVDAFGNMKKFNGSMTGTFSFQVTYDVCEEVPVDLFLEFDKCE